jgi:hypothetical protein
VEQVLLGPGDGGASPRIELSSAPTNGNSQYYQQQLGRTGSNHSQSVNGHLSPNLGHQVSYNSSDESDVEAAAGLAAMQQAEEQERADEARRRSGGQGLFSTYTSTQPYTGGGASTHLQTPMQTVASPDPGSDSDFVGVDMSNFSGGYAPSFSYGGEPNELAAGGTLGRQDSQSQPISSSGSVRRSGETSGDDNSYDYGMDNIHPFPPFSAASAQVDTFGTGGFAEPTSQRRRLSYDEDDESTFNQHVQPPPAGGEMPDMFYHPGMGQRRPLPPPPVDTRYQQQQHQMQPQDWRYNQTQSPRHVYTPEGYQSITPGGTLVPRSTSLISHQPTQQAQMPIRSKTDAQEQLRMRQGNRSSTFFSESATPPTEVGTIDLPTLPAGRRFNPSKLKESDFQKCREPWALSSIITWLKGMAEGEADLKEHAIVEGLVMLFTNKVPTMNVADAETISARVVAEMYKAGTLVHEEEWLKFSNETMTGVIYQLTGHGCYSQRLHEFHTPGRCYSYHCQRTIKKIDLNAQPQASQEDWVTFYKLKKEDIENISRHEVERQNNLHEVITGEDKYMADLDVLRLLYRDRLSSAQPPIIPPKKLKSFLNSVFGKVDAVRKANEEHLLPQLKYRQKEQGPWIVGFSDIFREWVRKAKQAYVDYAAAFPYANLLVRQEEARNMLFKGFMDQARAHKLSNKLAFDSFLKAPIARLQRYALLLDTIMKHSKVDNDEKRNLVIAIEEVKAVAKECDDRVGDMNRKVALTDLSTKLVLRPGMHVELNLDHLGRELIHRGDLQRMGGSRFTWQETHALLFDHYLVLAKTISLREGEGGVKSEKYDISKLVSGFRHTMEDDAPS